MTDMKIGIVGASGRMGGAVIRQVTETSGCVVAGATERLDSDAIGSDAGDVSGCGVLGVEIVRVTAFVSGLVIFFANGDLKFFLNENRQFRERQRL